jgi:hypothetical protein
MYLADSSASSSVRSDQAQQCTHTWYKSTKLATSCLPRTSTYAFESISGIVTLADIRSQNLQTTVQRIEGYVRVLEDKVDQATKKR